MTIRSSLLYQLHIGDAYIGTTQMLRKSALSMVPRQLISPPRDHVSIDSNNIQIWKVWRQKRRISHHLCPLIIPHQHARELASVRIVRIVKRVFRQEVGRDIELSRWREGWRLKVQWRECGRGL